MPFFYVCILTDIDMQSHHYTGFTADLQERLARHNRGAVPATASLAKGDQYILNHEWTLMDTNGQKPGVTTKNTKYTKTLGVGMF